MQGFTFTPELNMVMAVVVRTKAFVSGLLSITLYVQTKLLGNITFPGAQLQSSYPPGQHCSPTSHNQHSSKNVCLQLALHISPTHI